MEVAERFSEGVLLSLLTSQPRLPSHSRTPRQASTRPPSDKSALRRNAEVAWHSRERLWLATHRLYGLNSV